MDENSQQVFQQLSDELRALNEALAINSQVRMSAMKPEEIERMNLSNTFGRNSRAVGDNTVAVDTSSRAYKENLKAAQEYNQAMKNFEKSLELGAEGLGKVFNKIISQDPSRSMAKYSDGLSTLGDAVSKAAENFGPLGKAIGFTVQTITKVSGLYLKQADDLLKANDNLAKFGTAGAFTSRELLDMAHKAGVTSKNMDVLVKPIQSLGPALTNLGGTTGEGVKAFAKLAAVSNETREQYQRLGVSQEELMQNQADYIQLQRLTGKSLKGELQDKAALQKASLEYTDRLMTLSSITGENVESIKKQQAEARAAVNFQISQAKLAQEVKALEARGDPAGKELAEAKKKEMKAREEFLDSVAAMGDSQMTAAVQSRLATGTVTEQSAYLERMGVPMGKFEQALKKGADGTETAGKFMNSYTERMGEAIKNQGRAATFSDETAKAFGMNKKSMQNYGSMLDKDMTEEMRKSKAEREKAKESGKDPAQDARAKMTTVEIELGKAFDKLLVSGNFLVSGFNASTIAVGLFTGAVAVATGMLTKQLGSKLLDSGKNALANAAKGLVGGAAPVAATAAAPVAATAATAAAPVAATAAGTAAAGGAGTAASAATAAGTALSKLAGPLAGLSKAAPLIGTVMSVGTGVVDAYQGIKNADKDLKEGKITKEEARVEKGEAVGGGAGTAIGGTAGALKGAAAGAAIGSVVPVLGTAVGGIIGAALGGWLGSKAGKAIGEVAGGGIAKMTSDADKKVDEASKKADAKKDTKTANVLEKDSAKNKNDPVKVSIVKVEDPNLMKALGAMTPGTNLGTSESTGNVDAKAVTKSETKSFTFSEMELAKKDEKLYKEYLDRKKELFDKELEARKKNLPRNASAQRVLGVESIARDIADMQAKEEFAERAEKVGAAKIDRPVLRTSTAPKAADVAPITAVAKSTATESKPESNSRLTDLQRNRDEFEKKGPATDSAQSKLAYNNILQQMDRAIANEKAKASAPKAAIGGIFEGPKSGYPVELHGKEMITPLGSGMKTAAVPKSDDEDEELQKEIEAIKELKNTIKDTDSIFKKLTASVIKLDEIQKDILENEEDASTSMESVQDKLKNVFNAAAVDLSKFSNKIKIVTQESGSTGTGTGIKLPDNVGGILGGSAGSGTGSAKTGAPAAAEGQGIKPPSAPPLAGMGGGTGLKPSKDQDIKQNLGDVKAALMKRGMTDEKYLNSVLGNVMKESGGKIVNEKLDYSKTSNERIRGIFGSRAAGKTDAELNQIKSSEEGMGEFMYGKDTKIGRSMGNLEPGDGFKYRGRGYIQLTGKSNYAQASQAVFGDDRLVKDPDLLNEPRVAAEVVAWYMEKGKSRMASAMGIDEKNMTQDQANLLATSQIAGGDVRKKGAYVGGELMQKVTAYAGSKDIQGIQPSQGQGTMVASADTKKSEIPKAQRGGVFDGPDTGYLVELHGPETVIPNDKIASVGKQGLESITKMTGNVTTGGDTAMPSIDATSIAKKSIKLFSEEMGPTAFGMNEYAGYNQGPMSTDLGAISKMASKIGAYDDKTQTITDPEAWKKIVSSGIGTNYDLAGAELGTKAFDPEVGDVLGDRLKELMENNNEDLSTAMEKLTTEFREVLLQLKDTLTKQSADTVAGMNPSDPGEDPMTEMVSILSDIKDKLSESYDTQEKLLQNSRA